MRERLGGVVPLSRTSRRRLFGSAWIRGARAGAPGGRRTGRCPVGGGPCRWSSAAGGTERRRADPPGLVSATPGSSFPPASPSACSSRTRSQGPGSGVRARAGGGLGLRSPARWEPGLHPGRGRRAPLRADPSAGVTPGLRHGSSRAGRLPGCGAGPPPGRGHPAATQAASPGAARARKNQAGHRPGLVPSQVLGRPGPARTQSSGRPCVGRLTRARRGADITRRASLLPWRAACWQTCFRSMTYDDGRGSLRGAHRESGRQTSRISHTVLPGGDAPAIDVPCAGRAVPRDLVL